LKVFQSHYIITSGKDCPVLGPQEEVDITNRSSKAIVLFFHLAFIHWLQFGSILSCKQLGSSSLV